jgi:hypothetical protein
MDIGQNVRNGLAAMRRAVLPKAKADPFADPSPDYIPPVAGEASATGAEPSARSKRGWIKWALLAAVCVVPLYYLSGSVLTHRINDQLDFKAPAPAAGGSVAVSAMAALINREVSETAWAPNTQGFEPAALLRYGGNMVNYQSGMIRAMATFSLELEGQLGRSRGTSTGDPDLNVVRQKLAFSPDSWVVASIFPGGADNEYRQAREALLRYNQRLASGQAVYDIRADNLMAVLDRIALDLGSSSAALGDQMEAGRRVFIDRRADKLFYFTKGQAYAYFILLRGLRDDFAVILEQRRVTGLYNEMLEDLGRAAALQPMIVQNASPDAALIPNHLAVEGYHLMRARARLREITDIVQR